MDLRVLPSWNWLTSTFWVAKKVANGFVPVLISYNLQRLWSLHKFLLARGDLRTVAIPLSSQCSRNSPLQESQKTSADCTLGNLFPLVSLLVLWFPDFRGNPRATSCFRLPAQSTCDFLFPTSASAVQQEAAGGATRTEGKQQQGCHQIWKTWKFEKTLVKVRGNGHFGEFLEKSHKSHKF